MDHSISAPNSSRMYWSTDDIRKKIEKSKVVVFAKGDPEHPRDGFSAKAFRAIEGCGRPYDVVDVSEDSSIRAALRAYAGKMMLPLIYVDGDLVSDSDTLKKDLDSGELKARLERAFS